MYPAYRKESYARIVLPFILGIGAAATAIFLDELKVKTILALLAALAFLVGVLYFASRKNLTSIAIIFLGLGIPFNLDINLLYREYVGVTSIDIGLSLLSALLLYVLFLYEHYTKRTTEPTFRYNRTLLWAPIIYILSGMLSFANAASPELSLLELARLGSLLIIFFIVMNLKDRSQVDTFLLTLSAGVVIETAIAMYQYYTGHTLGLSALGERELGTLEVWYAGSRASGTIGHANILAYYFEILIPLMFAMFLGEERPLRKIWYSFVTIVGLVGIMTTLSRGGWMSLPLPLALVFFCLIRKKITQSKTLVGLFFVGMIFCGLGILAYPTVQKRLTYEDFGSAATRAPLNKAALSIVRQFPVFGVGLNNLAKVFKTYDTTGGSSLFRTSTHVVHNLYLAVWAETGTVGLIAFLWMFIAALVIAFKVMLRAPPWQQAIAVGAAAGLIAQLIHGSADPGFRILMNVSTLVYSMFGLIGAMSILRRKEESPGL
ncbi:MAG TPA: O-antigen ligase family protein [Syntrophorhabdaceae bacterium]|jgi:O-antigen ligase